MLKNKYSHLPEPSSYHCCTVFNNNYIFKFGGCRININMDMDVCQNNIYVYNIDKDEWSAVSFNYV